ncbi:MAG: rhodanese-like domain-containing protein [Sodalis sp. (in: enterobacteria)]
MQDIMQFIGNHSILSLAWVVLLSAVIFTTFQRYFFKVGEITRGEAICLINKEDAVIIDLRNRDDYRKGHIANSLNLTMTDIKSGNIGELEKAKDKVVILVCATGSRSRDLAQNMVKVGFERVYVLKEGIFGWNRENLLLVQTK